MNNLPTAEEYCRKHQNSNHPDMISKLMIEFAKLHVKAQAKEIIEKITLSEDPYTHCPECGQAATYVDEQSILNAYPESNIK